MSAKAAAPKPGDLRVEVLEDEADLARLEAPWRALEQRVAQPSLFAGHAFIASSWAHLRAATDRLHLIAVWQGDELVAIAPFKLGVERLHRMRVRTLDWIAMWDGDRPSVLSTLPLASCWEHVGNSLARSASRWDLLRLLEQPADLPLPASLLRLVHHQTSADAVGHAIRLDLPFDDYIASIASSVRTNWRKRRRKLFEQEPASTVERIDATPEALPGAIERFVAIERQSWKGEAGIGVGADDRHRAFYLDWFGRLGPDQASFHFLQRDGEDLAGLIVLTQGRIACSRHITYAPAHASLSPAVILRGEVVRSLCQRGLIELDLLGMRPSAGEQRHKTDWSTHQRATTAHQLYRLRSRLLPIVLAKRLKQALRRWRG